MYILDSRFCIFYIVKLLLVNDLFKTFNLKVLLLHVS